MIARLINKPDTWESIENGDLIILTHKEFDLMSDCYEYEFKSIKTNKILGSLYLNNDGTGAISGQKRVEWL